jgi:hypothetical protein
MDHALLMRVIERVSDLSGDPQRGAERQRAALEPARQRLAFDEFHDQERRRALFADVVERADVGMRNAGDRARLLAEAVEPSWRRVGSGVGQELGRDDAIEPCVTRAIDFAHPAGADTGEDFERAELRSWSQRHRLAHATQCNLPGWVAVTFGT